MPITLDGLFSLKGRTAIVTGAAMGLGKAMAEALAAAGADIAVADIDREAGSRSAAELADMYGVRTHYVHTDVTSEKSVANAVSETVEALSTLDVLVNNAGITKHEPLLDASLENWRQVMSVNLDGVFLMLREAGRVMAGRRSGSVINISSMSGLIANVPQAQASYNASKAAVVSMTQSAAAEWAQAGVRVNAIAPGYMKTDLTRPFFEAGGEQIDTWLSMTPMGRPGLPHELGGAAVYLASDASSFMTGAVVSIDGGYTAI